MTAGRNADPTVNILSTWMRAWRKKRQGSIFRLNVNTPVAKILMPKMQYPPSERLEVLRHAYLGFHQLVSRTNFEKYVDFIDVYAEVQFEV